MKRDMDLVRDILFAIEASETDPRAWIDLKLEGRSQQEVVYHVQLLGEAGLLIAQDLQTIGASGYKHMPKRLTWQGHEFLDTIRDPEVWRQTKISAQKVGGFSLDVISALAKGFIKEQVRKATGIEIDL